MNTSCSTQKNVIAFKIYSQENKKIMKVNKNGNVSVSGKKLGILTADGVLTNLENDTLAYKSAEGVVYSREHKPLGRIDKNSAIEIKNDEKFTWTADGKLKVKDKDFIRVEPNFKEFYHKASFLFIVYATLTESGKSLEIEGAD